MSPSTTRTGRLRAAVRALPALALVAAALVPATATAADNSPAGSVTNAAGQVCTTNVTSSEVRWGVKQSYRRYLQMPMNDGWTLAGGASFTGSQTGPDGAFVFPGTGATTAAGTTTVTGSGSVHFSGHGGVMDTTLRNVSVRVGADGSGAVVADYRTQQIGAGFQPAGWAEKSGATLATFTGASSLALTDAEVSAAGTYTKTATAASTVLTADGSTALDGGMGSYPAGQAVDNPTASVTYQVTCTDPAPQPEPAPANPDQPGTGGEDTKPGTGETQPGTGQTTPDQPGAGDSGQTSEPAADPKVTISPASITDLGADTTITVKGTGFYGTKTGVYVSAAKASTWEPGTVPPMTDRSVFVGTQYVPLKAIPKAPMVPLKDGSFEVTVTIPAGTVKAGEEWNIVTFAASKEVYSNRALDTATALTIPAASTDDGTGESDDRSGTSGNDGSTGQAGSGTDSGTDTGTDTGTASTAGSAQTGENKPELQCKVTGYTVTSGSLAWGVRSSFRAYVTGSIAKGSVEETGFRATGGVADPASRTATIAFTGRTHFTGHGGILNLTISNPTVHITSPTSGYLTATMSSTDTSGKAVNPGTVRIANLTFSGVSITEGKVSASTSAVTLTEAGASAFAGFYKAGEALDNLTLQASLSDQVSCYDENGNLVSGPGSTSANALARTGAGAPMLVLVSLGALAAGGLVLARRRA